MDECPYCEQENLDPRNFGRLKWCYICEMWLFNRDLLNIETEEQEEDNE